MSLTTSQFLIKMVEAGRKQLDVDKNATESVRELRRQLTDLQRELERQRTRNEELERQLQHTVHSEITAYVRENPGATTPQIIQHIANTVPGRVAGHLDVLEGDTIRVSDGQYYPQKSDSEQTSSQRIDNDSD
jgi:predicted RNase H-like nuclease (RuvC/YqgF family)